MLMTEVGVLSAPSPCCLGKEVPRPCSLLRYWHGEERGRGAAPSTDSRSHLPFQAALGLQLSCCPRSPYPLTSTYLCATLMSLWRSPLPSCHCSLQTSLRTGRVLSQTSIFEALQYGELAPPYMVFPAHSPLNQQAHHGCSVLPSNSS